MDTLRHHSPAAERNGPPILAMLQRLLPPRGVLLEIASGSGQHAALFGAGLPGWQWQPSDFNTELLPSIAAWCEGLENVRPPVQLDVTAATWPDVPERVDAIYCANMIHASPWATTPGLMQGAARHLAPQGLLITYGPYLFDDEPTAQSNLDFDADLRGRGLGWGLRHLNDVAEQAGHAGLRLRERLHMPANNKLLVWERAA